MPLSVLLNEAEEPLWSRFDTVSYTDLHKDGIADRMSFAMGVKSIIDELPRHIHADGSGLPAGEGNAVEGAVLYAQQCARCHV